MFHPLSLKQIKEAVILTCIFSQEYVCICVRVCLSVYFEEVGYVGKHNLALGKLSEDICMCRILILSGSVMNYLFNKFYLLKSIFLSLTPSKSNYLRLSQ